MPTGSTAGLRGGPVCSKRIQPGSQALSRQRCQLFCRNTDAIRLLAALFKTGDGFIQSKSTWQKLMHLPDLLIEALPQLQQPVSLCSILLRRTGPADLQHLLQLVQHVLFPGLVGVKLQTERTDAHLTEPALHHRQCRHFFRYEQDTLSLKQRIGNEIGNGLGFAGTGRAMENKAAALPGCTDCRKLGRIGTQRNRQICRRILIVQFLRCGKILCRCPGHMPCHQTVNHRISGQIFSTVADIIPHDKLAEGEKAKKGQLLHIPTGMTHDSLTDDTEHTLQIYALFIGGQRIQSPDGQAKVLPEHFQKGNIHLGILVTQPDQIPILGAFADNIHRQQHQRCMPGLFTYFRLVPPQQAQRQIKGIGAIFLEADPGLPVKIGNPLLQFSFFQPTANPMLAELLLKQMIDQGIALFQFKNTGIPHSPL